MKIAIGLVFIFGLSACYMSTRSITSRVVRDEREAIIYRDKSRSDYVLIEKVINSTCHCADVIAEKYVNSRIVYRLYYGCSIYKTRKELYSYCSQGAVGGPRIFDGTEEHITYYRTRLDATDKFVLHKIDSFIQAENDNRGEFKLCKRNINGFKEVFYRDSTNIQDL